MKRDLEEKTIISKTVFEGKVIRLQVDDVQLPNGNISKREIVKHPGAVAIMAVTDENKMVFVRQFRKPLEKTILEIPAGKLEAGEDPLACAVRELEEETGYKAGEVKHVVSFYTSPGFADEYLHVYEARNLAAGKVNLDQDEFVERIELSLEESMERIKSGEICDAKTVAAVYLWQNRVLSEK
jgi:ADP-ribose pyrophosphatase